jgi:hypothetical protein
MMMADEAFLESCTSSVGSEARSARKSSGQASRGPDEAVQWWSGGTGQSER